MLGRILEGFEAAELDGRFDLCRVPADPIGDEAGVERAAVGRSL